MKRVGKGFSGRETPLFPTMMVQNQAEMGEGSAIPTDPHHTPTIIQPSTSQPQKKQRSRRPKRKDTEVPQPSGPTTNVVDEAVYKEMDDSLEKAATTATVLDAEQDRVNIDKTQSKTTPNEPSSLGTRSGGGPRCQETIGDTIAQARSENVSKFSNDPLLTRVLDLENTKTAQAQEITSLKLRVKKLEKKGGSRTHKLKRLYKVGRSARIVSSDEASLGDQEDASKQGRKIDDIDKDAEITLVDETQGRYGDDIMFDVSDLASEEVFVAEQGVSDKDVNLSVDEVTLAQALAALKSAKVQEKANVIEGLIGREKAEANIALKETWDDIQAKIEADHKKSRREKEQTTNKISTAEYHVYLSEKTSKGMEDQRLRARASQESRDELEQESIKKQKVDEDKKTAKAKSQMEVHYCCKRSSVDAIPLAYYAPWNWTRLRILKLVKAKYGSTILGEDLDLVLYGDLKTMFDPHVKD
ncbi:hypothetical protein Tco_1153260 [Tanacetum coccineum]